MEPTNNNFNTNPYSAGPEPLPPQQPMAPQQPVMPQQPVQPMTYQQPVQPMQPVPTPYGSNIAFTNAAPKKSKGFLIIIVLVLLCLVAVGGGLAFAMINTQSTPTPAQPDNSANKTKFEDLTKEEAIAFLKTAKNNRGVVPEDFIDSSTYDAITVNSTLYGMILADSYDSYDELEQHAHQKFDVFTNALKYLGEEIDENDVFEIEEYDYFAVIKPKKAIEDCTGAFDNCNYYLSFKKAYIESVGNDTYSSYQTTKSDNTYYLKNFDMDVAKKILPVYSLGSAGLSLLFNVYSYDIKDTGDEIVLTANIVLPGRDFSDTTSSSYSYFGSGAKAINLVNGIISVDKSSGLITSNLMNAGLLDSVVKVLPATEEELQDIPSYQYLQKTYQMYYSSLDN